MGVSKSFFSILIFGRKFITFLSLNFRKCWSFPSKMNQRGVFRVFFNIPRRNQYIAYWRLRSKLDIVLAGGARNIIYFQYYRDILVLITSLTNIESIAGERTCPIPPFSLPHVHLTHLFFGSVGRRPLMSISPIYSLGRLDVAKACRPVEEGESDRDCKGCKGKRGPPGPSCSHPRKTLQFETKESFFEI